MRDVPNGTGPGTLSYLLADHLGSTVGALDAAGNSLGTQAYWPFGAARSGSIAQTDKLYTSQQREALTTTQTPLQGATDALGTYFYNARFYSPVTGRFASADPVAVDGLNRYSYARNSPEQYIDESGYAVTCGLWDCGDTSNGTAAVDGNAIDTCASNLVDCFWFSAGGDPVRYIELVAGYFYLPPELLAAIVLNEYLSIDFDDTLDGSELWDWLPLIGDWGDSIGIAQVNIGVAMTLEKGRGFNPDLVSDRRLTIRRLNEPRWAIFYAAALLYDHAIHTFYSFKPVTDADYIVAYQGGLETWDYWQDEGGCDVCGNNSPRQIAKVRALYPTAIVDLARVVAYNLETGVSP